MKKCVIVSSQPVSAALKTYIGESDFVIAADAGWQRAAELDVQPGLVVGDFDSSSPPANAPELLRLPAEKDDTDTMFAAREALRRGYHNVTILGALGGRFDHALANLQVLLFLAQNGAQSRMADETTEVKCAAPGQLEVKAVPGRCLSVFAAGGKATGVTLQGVKYPLLNAVLTPEYPLGVSNEFEAEKAMVSHESGYLYVITAEKE